ncbi:MAG: hypothetical protein PHH82_01240 [Candidatus ainarchaeum sp.]|nr:hypothetical protein [Candidatus ainarchaeum sp.]
MENSFINGLTDAFKNWKALLINAVIVTALALIQGYFIYNIVENLIFIMIGNQTNIFSAFGYYLAINPWDIIILLLCTIVFILISSLAPTITYNIFEKKNPFSNYWRVVGLFCFIFILSIVLALINMVASFSTWLYITVGIIEIIILIFLAIRLFYLVPNLVLDSTSFRESWLNSKEKIKGKSPRILLLLILFFALVHIVDALLTTLYSYGLPLYGYYIIGIILATIVGTWFLMTMYHKY